MRKLAAILLVCTAVLTGCTSSFKDIKVTSFDIVSITPKGLSELAATIEVGVDNPTVSFIVKDVESTVKLDGTPCFNIFADQVVVDGRCEKKYSVPLRAEMCDNFNPFQLLTMIQDRNLARFTVSVKAFVELRSGIGKTFEIKDVPLDQLLKL